MSISNDKSLSVDIFTANLNYLHFINFLWDICLNSSTFILYQRIVFKSTNIYDDLLQLKYFSVLGTQIAKWLVNPVLRVGLFSFSYWNAVHLKNCMRL